MEFNVSQVREIDSASLEQETCKKFDELHDLQTILRRLKEKLREKDKNFVKYKRFYENVVKIIQNKLNNDSITKDGKQVEDIKYKLIDQNNIIINEEQLILSDPNHEDPGSDKLDRTNVRTTITKEDFTISSDYLDKEDVIVINNQKIVKLDEDIYIPLQYYRKLYSHQKKGLFWFSKLHRNNLGGILADDMGLGKTITVLSLINSLIYSSVNQKYFKNRNIMNRYSHLNTGNTNNSSSNKDNSNNNSNDSRGLIGEELMAREDGTRRILIVCNVTLIEQWKNEINKWVFGDIKLYILHSNYDVDRDYYQPNNNKNNRWNINSKHNRNKDKTDGGRSNKDNNNEGEEDLFREDESKNKGLFEDEDMDNSDGYGEEDDENSLFMDRDKEVGVGYMIYLIGYEYLRMNIEYINNYEWYYLILDEGQKIRNPNSLITLAVKTIKTPHRIILSGSPIQNNLIELWSLIDFILPNYLGSLSSFIEDFVIPITSGGSGTQHLNNKYINKLRMLILPYIFRTLKPSKSNKKSKAELGDEDGTTSNRDSNSSSTNKTSATSNDKRDSDGTRNKNKIKKEKDREDEEEELELMSDEYKIKTRRNQQDLFNVIIGVNPEDDTSRDNRSNKDKNNEREEDLFKEDEDESYEEEKENEEKKRKRNDKEEDKEDVELPNKIEGIILCNLTMDQYKLYVSALNKYNYRDRGRSDRLSKEVRRVIGKELTKDKNMLRLINILRKICNHPRLLSYTAFPNNYMYNDNTEIPLEEELELYNEWVRNINNTNSNTINSSNKDNSNSNNRNKDDDENNRIKRKKNVDEDYLENEEDNMNSTDDEKDNSDDYGEDEQKKKKKRNGDKNKNKRGNKRSKDDRFNLYKIKYKDHKSNSSSKLNVSMKIIEIWRKQGNKILLFTQTISMSMIIYEELLKRYGREEIAILNGKININNRNKIIDRFTKDNKIFIMLLTTKVGGVGLNLTVATRIIIYDPDWNPMTDLQARERSYRIGQKKDVIIYRLITANTIEEKIYQRQLYKCYLTQKILNNYHLSFFNKYINNLQYLLSYPPPPYTMTSNRSNKDKNNEREEDLFKEDEDESYEEEKENEEKKRKRNDKEEDKEDRVNKDDRSNKKEETKDEKKDKEYRDRGRSNEGLFREDKRSNRDDGRKSENKDKIKSERSKDNEDYLRVKKLKKDEIKKTLMNEEKEQNKEVEAKEEDGENLFKEDETYRILIKNDENHNINSYIKYNDIVSYNNSTNSENFNYSSFFMSKEVNRIGMSSVSSIGNRNNSITNCSSIVTSSVNMNMNRQVDKSRELLYNLKSKGNKNIKYIITNKILHYFNQHRDKEISTNNLISYFKPIIPEEYHKLFKSILKDLCVLIKNEESSHWKLRSKYNNVLPN